MTGLDSWKKWRGKEGKRVAQPDTASDGIRMKIGLII